MFNGLMMCQIRHNYSITITKLFECHVMLILIDQNCGAKGGEIIQLYKVLGVMGRGKCLAPLLGTAFKFNWYS